MIQCCLGCEKRFVGCHATCETYIAAKAQHDAEREAAWSVRREIVGYGKSKSGKFLRIRRTYEARRAKR